MSSDQQSLPATQTAADGKKVQPRRSGLAGLAIPVIAAVKFSKILTVVGTMALSIFTYSFVFGWPYAVGFVVLLFVHEMGHYIAAHQKGLNVGAPTFIPFVGAWIALKDKPLDAKTEAYVGFAGPLLGTFGAVVCYCLWLHYHLRLYLALSYAGFFLNLFNLIPLSPFDGGRITAVLSPRIWFFGVPILAAIFIMRPNPLLIVMGLLAIPQLIKAFKYNPALPENAAYYSTSLATKALYGFLYIALAGYLSIMCHDVHTQLQLMSEIQTH